MTSRRRLARWTVALAVAVLAAAVIVAVIARSSDTDVASADTPHAISVFPGPGTPTANPRTQISIRGIAPRDIGPVRIVGSRTGVHRYRLRSHSDGRGASLLPLRPFRQGERVTVTTKRQVLGVRGRTYHFRIARIARIRPFVRGDNTLGTPLHTLPRFSPPPIKVLEHSPAAAPGLIFVAPKLGEGQAGPMIIDDAGAVRWFRPLHGKLMATDFDVQTYRGKPVLTWWQGLSTGPARRGYGMILDSHYRLLERVEAGNGYQVNQHEFRLTPQGTALILAYSPVRWDLRPIGGSRNGIAMDGIVQEIDLKTGLVLFEWHSLGHIPLRDTNQDPPDDPSKDLDYVHLNSIEPDGPGALLVSSRHTSTVYEISRRTGRVLWRLGGPRSSFKMGPRTIFRLQHDARRQPDGTIRLFDNFSEQVGYRSRVLTLRLNMHKMTATFVRQVIHPPRLRANTQGNGQVLPNGDTFVGWGSSGMFSEIAPDGTIVFDAQVPKDYDSYRAYRWPWVGTPAAKPRVAVRADGARTRVYASWNGSTQVTRWEVLAGKSAATLAPVVTAPWRQLETAITAPSRGPYFAVRALDANGKVLRTSAVAKLG